jgi:AcrR family transcriptional regulator
MKQQKSPMIEPAPKRRHSTKSIRTRELLKSVTRDIFEREGHGGVTAQSVSSAAAFAYGTFYKYYKNKDALLFEICAEYFEILLSGIAEAYKGDTPFLRIFSSQRYFIESVVKDWHFYQSFRAYSQHNREMGDLIHEARVKEAKRTADELVCLWQSRGSTEATFSPERAILMAFALNGMTERYLEDILRPFTAEEAVAALEINVVAFELSRLFYRSAFLEEPEITIDQLPS